MNGRAFSIWTAAADLVALGLLTLLLCLPVLTICPAVTALYYSVAKSVRRGRGGRIVSISVRSRRTCCRA